MAHSRLLNFFKNFKITYPQKSLTSSAKGAKEPLDTNFNDAVAAFKSKTTIEVFRGYVVYQLCSFPWIVENNAKLMKIFHKCLGTYLFSHLMKASIYGHFVAGADEKEIKPLLHRLMRYGVKPILDYSAEEDISNEEAKKREVSGSVSEAKEEEPPSKQQEKPPGNSKNNNKFQVNEKFADRRQGVQSARTYFYLNEKTCDQHLETYQNCIRTVSELTPPEGRSEVLGRGISAVKMTALARPQLLLQLSEVIQRTRHYMAEIFGTYGNVLSHNVSKEDLLKKFESHGIKGEHVTSFVESATADSKGLIHLFPWSGIVDENFQLSETFRVPDLKNGKMTRLITQITPKEEQMFRNVIDRVNIIAKAAIEHDVRVMIDAEHTYFQPAISRITLEMMRKYNTDKSYIQNTYQCYLKEALNECTGDLDQAKRQNFYFGAKLVRGAYIELERARAAAMGYEDPTCKDFEATSEMLKNTLMENLKHINYFKENGKEKRAVIMMATHNEESVKFTINKMKELKIEPDDETVTFGQLLGMCDYITFPLGQSGYCAYKYVPYGPVMEVMPYLSRRASENKGVLQKIKKEKKLLLSELTRRIFTGNIFYKPLK